MMAGTKDLTRRLGWNNLKPGQRFWAIEKGQGLKKGEHIVRICECECISNTRERLDEIIKRPRRGDFSECYREGFQMLTPGLFVVMFCKEMKVTPQTMVNRIEFRRVP